MSAQKAASSAALTRSTASQGLRFLCWAPSVIQAPAGPLNPTLLEHLLAQRLSQPPFRIDLLPLWVCLLDRPRQRPASDTDSAIDVKGNFLGCVGCGLTAKA